MTRADTLIRMALNEGNPVAHLSDGRLSKAIENHRAGFHFDEGGCWGMAHALHDHLRALGHSPTIKADDGHAWVELGGKVVDHQGLRSEKWSGATHTPDTLRAAAARGGISGEQYEADRAWASEILKSALNEGAHNFIRRAFRSNRSYELLDADPEIKGSTWASGGCGVAARALHKVMGGEIKSVVDHHGVHHHAVLHHGGHFYDMDGEHTEAQMLGKMARREV